MSPTDKQFKPERCLLPTSTMEDFLVGGCEDTPLKTPADIKKVRKQAEAIKRDPTKARGVFYSGFPSSSYVADRRAEANIFIVGQEIEFVDYIYPNRWTKGFIVSVNPLEVCFESPETPACDSACGSVKVRPRQNVKVQGGSANRTSSSTRPGSGASHGTPRSSGSSRTPSSRKQGYPGSGSTPRLSASSRRATSLTSIDVQAVLDAGLRAPSPGQRSSQGTKGSSSSSRISSSSQLSSAGSSGYESSNGSSRTSASRQRSSGGSQGYQESSGSTPRSSSSSRRSSQSSLGTQSSRRSATSNSTLGDDACIVCMDNLANAVLAPCGHHNLCMGCAERLSSKICPTCRAPFSMIIKKVG